ncbi:hypothetical protein QR680_017937 [Steinernema hermaphroditum]|uniref:Lon proteolytic domain-containing protein n=1 Tax=Steinernema hermaphroditum TaxID=289476 RepID=A0AA39LPX8_9BILA|nr:hypothetical protein QR680_017937 [Steinernema hermaphroditum]
MMTCSAKWASYLPREDRLEKGEKLREKKMSETILPIHQSTKRKEKSAEWTKVILELPWGKFCEEGGSIRNIEQALKDLRRTYDHLRGFETLKRHLLEHRLMERTLPHFKVENLKITGHPEIWALIDVSKALGRPVETIRFDANSRAKDVLGSNDSLGSVMQAILRAKCCNPVIRLEIMDEIEDVKLWNVLCKLTDRTRNNAFVDRFLDVPFDLSNVHFLVFMKINWNATKTSEKRTILPGMPHFLPFPLGPSTDEKIRAVKKSILPTILQKYDLKPNLFPDDTLRLLIDFYTNEPGIDDLTAKLDSVAKNVQGSVLEQIERSCGERWSFDSDMTIVEGNALRTGCARMLGVYLVGGFKGDVAVMESSFRPESFLWFFPFRWFSKDPTIEMDCNSIELRSLVETAYNYIRKNSDKFGIPKKNLTKSIDVKFPNGDGLSSGCSIFLSLFSLLSGRRVRSDSAVSGAIQLSGRTFAVGGLHQKADAAFKNGIKRIVFPKGNEVDISNQIEERLKKEMTFAFVETVEELIEEMILKEKAPILEKHRCQVSQRRWPFKWLLNLPLLIASISRFPWQMGLQVAAQFSSPYTLLFLFGASEAFVTFRLRGNGRRTQ